MPKGKKAENLGVTLWANFWRLSHVKPLPIRLRTEKVGFSMRLFESMVDRKNFSSTVICSIFGRLRFLYSDWTRYESARKSRSKKPLEWYLLDGSAKFRTNRANDLAWKASECFEIEIIRFTFLSCLLIPASKIQLIGWFNCLQSSDRSALLYSLLPKRIFRSVQIVKDLMRKLALSMKNHALTKSQVI